MRTVNAGTTFTIAFRAITQSGYLWHAPEPDALPDSVHYVRSEIHPLPNFAGCCQLFHFKALHPGHISLTFTYRRARSTNAGTTHTTHVRII